MFQKLFYFGFHKLNYRHAWYIFVPEYLAWFIRKNRNHLWSHIHVGWYNLNMTYLNAVYDTIKQKSYIDLWSRCNN